MNTDSAKVLNYMRWGVVAVVAVCLLVVAQPAAARVSLADLLARIEALEAQVAVLEQENAVLRGCLRVDQTTGDVIVEGCNLYVLNGQGSTISLDGNGKGNVIVGYDAERSTGNEKTGSHNVVIGDYHNYSSYGGLVAGYRNSITGAWASVTGGRESEASGTYATVCGGFSNTASGESASVSGQKNTASGSRSTALGGVSNTASGRWSSVCGGAFNTASGDNASVSGGELNTASGIGASISGGGENTASGLNASVSGGRFNEAAGNYSSILGGHDVILNPPSWYSTSP